MIKIGRIQKICCWALLIRLVVLLCIFVITPEWAVGFLNADTKQDDVRYEMGAIRYYENASSLIDHAAFASAYSYYGDNVGVAKNVFSATPLWYWIVCFLYYVFRTTLAVRLLNIVLSVFSVFYLYRLVKLEYGEKTAITAARLLAFLPYPIIFSCFGYKDTFVMMLTISVLYFALLYRKTKAIGAKGLIKALLTALALLLVRGGMSAILLVICLGIAFFEKKHMSTTKLILIVVSACAAIIIIIRAWPAISLRIQAYITGRDITELGGISLVTITKVKDIYKLPFAFLFAVVQPLSHANLITSWYGITGICNICMAPIAVGAIVDIFLHKRNDWLFFTGCLCYYLISIIASIGIFRHYYSLLFIPIMMAAHSKHYGNDSFRTVRIIGSMVYLMVLFVYTFRIA